MRNRGLRTFGFFLTFFALTVFVLHQNHIHLNANTGSSHCCVCHTVPMGASRPDVDQTPVVYLVYDVWVPDHVRPFNAVYCAESPRGPPAA